MKFYCANLLKSYVFVYVCIPLCVSISCIVFIVFKNVFIAFESKKWMHVPTYTYAHVFMCFAYVLLWHDKLLAQRQLLIELFHACYNSESLSFDIHFRAGVIFYFTSRRWRWQPEINVQSNCNFSLPSMFFFLIYYMYIFLYTTLAVSERVFATRMPVCMCVK